MTQFYSEPVGWWMPNSRSLSFEENNLRNTLMNLSKPLYLLDINGTPRAVSGGEARLGNGITKQEGEYPILAHAPALPLENLGDPLFKARHNLKYPYIAGAMANGITSTTLVETMARAGMTGFFGAGGLAPAQVEEAVLYLKSSLGHLPFGSNLIHSPGDPELEMEVVRIYLKHNIRMVSAAAFMRMTLPLVYYRVKGIHRDQNGRIMTPNRVIAKVSRVEVARHFFSPPPEKLLNQLVEQRIPMAQDLTAEADSGGHTDNRPALALLPTMIAVKDEFTEKFGYARPLTVGLAGGIATPESAAAAFHMGAAYILTGSVNQSCLESGTSSHVRKLLCRAEQADVAMAPAADMFEIGAKVQVLKRGTLFPLRAEKLNNLYKNHQSFGEIPARIRQEVEEKILQAGFEETWQKTREFFMTRNPKEVERGDSDPRHRMALVFRSYLGLSARWSIMDEASRRMDYQIWCGPAMGAFNQWVSGSHLEDPENRHVDEVALNLLFGASVVTRAGWLGSQGVSLPAGTTRFRPMEKNEILNLLDKSRTR